MFFVVVRSGEGCGVGVLVYVCVCVYGGREGVMETRSVPSYETALRVLQY